MHVYPCHTDYAGVVWHGSYVEWLEAARVDCLRSWGIAYADLVALGCNLPVVDLSIRYRRPILMGMDVLVCARLLAPKRLRLPWEYEIRSGDRQTLYTTATVTLVPVDLQGNLMGRIPPVLQAILPSHGKNT
ncbi:MAG: thioesterase family protein [Leptolyngbyaceae bacterium]|nr:thioesterase family protein [Leptolyngbyaceae bacterium]